MVERLVGQRGQSVPDDRIVDGPYPVPRDAGQVGQIVAEPV